MRSLYKDLPMRSFLKRVLKFLIIPIVIITLATIGYFVFDPFKALYSYDSYSHTHSNRDYYSVEMFNKRYLHEKYDSFIFGSSRTLGYNPSSWKKHLSNDASPFMLDGYGENIYGIYHKIKYLDSLNVNIRNVLIIFDTDATLVNTKPLDGFLYTKHPLISGNSMFSFQLEQFLAYFNANMILRYYLYRFGGVKNDFIYHYLGNIRASVDPISNELRRDDLDRQIENDPNFFNRPVFYSRPDEVGISGVQIEGEVYEMLKTIAAILKKHNTDYKIIIGPDYNQNKYCDSDKQKLDELFGEKNVYDFSGKNAFTESKYNYYENSHYRPLVGDSIMNYIYKQHN